ncbi:TPA: hypothetical protein QCY05_000064 [Bacillus wiedmannii]|nr:hypothetical protein [Bacillus wiedmannii]
MYSASAVRNFSTALSSSLAILWNSVKTVNISTHTLSATKTGTMRTIKRNELGGSNVAQSIQRI